MTLENPEKKNPLDSYVERSKKLFEDYSNDQIDQKDYIQKSKDLLEELKNDTSVKDSEKEDEMDALQRLIETEEQDFNSYSNLKNLTDLPNKEDLSNNQN